jgi:hypothetical protein
LVRRKEIKLTVAPKTRRFEAGILLDLAAHLAYISYRFLNSQMYLEGRGGRMINETDQLSGVIVPNLASWYLIYVGQVGRF